jgi:4-hydroxybenzoate polyprenyltransferase
MTTALQETSLVSRFSVLARDIKLSHTVFALPFAVLSAFLAARGVPRAGQLFLVLVCMVSARTLAMSMNRLLDASLDAKNPRTKGRAIPAGRLPRGFVVGVIVFCAAVFELACAGFGLWFSNWIPVIAGPFVLAFLAGYPLMKRYTALCHYYLGAALAAAPICAWLAITPSLAWTPLILAGAVVLWTAGFDILYACQDYESDLETGTFSVPAKLGKNGAFWVARVSHVGAGVLLLSLPLTTPLLGVVYWCGAGLACGLLVVEHCVVSPRDLTKLNLAFFTLNGCVSLVVGSCGVADVLLR